MLTVPDLEADGPAGDRLLRPYFGMHRTSGPTTTASSSTSPTAKWIRLLRANGFEIEDSIEVQPAPDAHDPLEPASTPEWARSGRARRPGWRESGRRARGGPRRPRAVGDLAGGVRLANSPRPALRARRRGRLAATRRLLPDHAPEEAHRDEEAAEQRDQAEAAVGRVRALWGTSWRPTPKTTAQPMNSSAEEELAVRAGDSATQRGCAPRPTSRP